MLNQVLHPKQWAMQLFIIGGTSYCITFSLSYVKMSVTLRNSLVQVVLLSILL